MAAMGIAAELRGSEFESTGWNPFIYILGKLVYIGRCYTGTDIAIGSYQVKRGLLHLIRAVSHLIQVIQHGHTRQYATVR